MSPSSQEPVPHRLIITLCTVGATLMQALDQTIANVALPYMQGSLSATYDEITWVLTSYITAAAIMTAPVGWLAARFGRKYLFITCLIGFTVTSMMCGAAQSLSQMVAFRLMQGVFGAALVPLSQATMMDIYPIEQRGTAMAIWGVGVMVGPILGPTLGGYLTEMYNWRWVFYINLPFGVLATLGLMIFMPRSFGNFNMRFDWIGFAVLALGIGGLQLMLDRGQDQDWFTAREIIIEAVLAGLGFYLFIVHMATAKKPFIPPVLFRDRNFAAGLLLMFATGTILVSSSSLMAPWLQNLANYPVETAGLIMAPRGIGTMAAMLLGGRLSNKMDPRILMAIGILALSWSMWEMTGWTPDVAQWEIITTIVIQGTGLGFIFLPLQVVAFATLAPQYRTDGASLFSLFRNIGAAIGVSATSAMLSHNTQVLHEQIGAYVTPFNRALQDGGAVQHAWNPAHTHGAAVLDAMVNQQAQIIAYIDDYWMMIFTTLPSLLLLVLMRRPRLSSAPAEAAHAAMD
ncbi:DHA2 family efflux MFS transporter permease subunit [Rhodopila globiformis]|uniref:EmrB/QacA family drug resistance transporter n=1 Tax=Rhodopila globiformis TaxID=1071 RepID=A0A2S6NGE7_RHOGL|nr:DHA2 family efflux MFS transporter permease subunit [Rhodopila globiformis]PPQ33677.1 EmrB/QacA family drug resistance transporter [Rhodopila globiformis]